MIVPRALHRCLLALMTGLISPTANASLCVVVIPWEGRFADLEMLERQLRWDIAEYEVIAEAEVMSVEHGSALLHVRHYYFRPPVLTQEAYSIPQQDFAAGDRVLFYWDAPKSPPVLPKPPPVLPKPVPPPSAAQTDPNGLEEIMETGTRIRRHDDCPPQVPVYLMESEQAQATVWLLKKILGETDRQQH